MQVYDISLVEIQDDDLNTGDIILCHGYNPKGLDPGIDGMIEFFTHSPWEHTAIVIRDPWWVNLPKGLYIYQSGGGPNNYVDVINGNRCGVTLNHFNDFMENREHIYVRKLTGEKWDALQKSAFVTYFNESHGKPYDKNCCSWIAAGINSFFCCKLCNICIPKTDKTFWCSALVGFIYVKMGWIDKDTDWSSLTPEDIAVIKTNEPFNLSKIINIKK